MLQGRQHACHAAELQRCSLSSFKTILQCTNSPAIVLDPLCMCVCVCVFVCRRGLVLCVLWELEGGLITCGTLNTCIPSSSKREFPAPLILTVKYSSVDVATYYLFVFSCVDMLQCSLCDLDVVV